MSQYPILTAGPLSVATLQSMVPNTVVKTSSTDRTSTTMLDDPDLQGVALAVGTWEIDVGIQCATPTTSTQKIRTQWSFTGTWSTPIRYCLGPGNTNTGLRDAITPMQLNGQPTSTDAVYGLAASSGFTMIREWSKFVVVTVAGTMALVWAENAFSANGTSVKSGSYITARQIG